MPAALAAKPKPKPATEQQSNKNKKPQQRARELCVGGCILNEMERKRSRSIAGNTFYLLLLLLLINYNYNIAQPNNTTIATTSPDGGGSS